MRTIENEMQMQISAQAENERFVRSTIAAFIAQLDPTLSELTDLRTAVSEAVTNAIVHGYQNRGGTIYISVQLFAKRTVRIRVRDNGVGIADIQQAMQPLYTGDPEGERGGMGFTIMQSFTDKLRVCSHPGQGTTVTMTKTLV